MSGTMPHRLCAAWDIAGYGRREPGGHDRLQSDMIAVLNGACDVASGGSPDGAVHQPQGDGGLIVFPAGIDEPTVLRVLLAEFEHRLEIVNRPLNTGSRIRVRLVLHSGLVGLGENGFTGSAVIAVVELCNAMPIKRALASATGDHVVVLSDRIYQEAARLGLGPAALSAFTAVTVPLKNSAMDAWVRAAGGGGRAPAARPGPVSGGGLVLE